MDDQILTFVLLLIGFVLLGIELVIPSGGMIGVISAACFLGSAYFANRAWATSNPLYWKIYVASFLVMIPLTLAGVHHLLTRTRFGNRVLLSAPSKDEVTPYQGEAQRLSQLVGRHGKAVTPLRPSGLVQIEGERLHATGQGFFIEVGEPIEVVSIRGAGVVVRQLTTEEVARAEQSARQRPAAPAEEIVDNSDTPAAPEQAPLPPAELTRDDGEILDPFADDRDSRFS